MRPESARILYVAGLWEGSTSLNRMRALQALGARVESINMLDDAARRRRGTLVERLRAKLFGPRDLAGANAALVRAARRQAYDVVWVDRGQTLEAATLREVRRLRPEMPLVHYNPDDPFGALGPHDWKIFLRAIPQYDLHLVPRRPNVEEYRGAGAPRVRQVVPFWGYCEAAHRPAVLSDAERRRFGAPVGFIGTAEQDRARTIARLAGQDVSVKVWGQLWDVWQKRTQGKFIVAGPARHDDHYAKIICAFDVNLAFLRKANRDAHTSRSVEIPACGAFMLAERTEEHRSLFEEGHEAEYFEGDAELLDKVRFYLAHPDRRRAVAEAGYRRCLSSGYDDRDVMRRMLEVVTRELA